MTDYLPGTCGSCRHWARPNLDKLDWNAEPHPDDYQGECKRLPPAVFMVGARPQAVRPKTDEADWCGEWLARYPVEPQARKQPIAQPTAQPAMSAEARAKAERDATMLKGFLRR